MAAGGQSGKNGKVEVASSAVADITGWTLNQKHNSVEYKSSDTAGAVARVEGYTDWSAAFRYKVPVAGKMAFAIGSSVAVKLYVNATKYWEGTGFIDELTIEVDVEGPGVISGNATINGNGAITPPA